MITVDTSAVLALIDQREEFHAATDAILRRELSVILPSATLGEVAYFVERKFGQRVLLKLVGDLINGAFRVEDVFDDLPRIRELVERYADLPLDLVDAAVIACAERNGGRVLTYDFRHFGVVAGEGTTTLVQ